MPPAPRLPDYDGACLSNVVPAILGRRDAPAPWLPAPVATAEQVVLLVLDGLGWEQLRARAELAPTLSAMTGGPATAVCPSTTATCLSSLTTGSPPARHGVVGYRVHVGGGAVLNVLRWRTADGDAMELVPPETLCAVAPFRGTGPPVVTRSEFAGGGFSGAHLAGARLHGWRMPSTLVTHVASLVDAGEPFVYAYYDGVDKVAHEHGAGRFYDAEVAAADRIVRDVLDVLPSRAVLVVTADHGQVDVGPNVVPVHDDVVAACDFMSGEGRFRWLHARPGRARELADAARHHHGADDWVRTREEAESEGWFGGSLTDAAASRLGDVVLAAARPVAFPDPSDRGESTLVSRHGSLTPAEMLVPLLVASGGAG